MEYLVILLYKNRFYGIMVIENLRNGAPPKEKSISLKEENHAGRTLFHSDRGFQYTKKLSIICL